MHYRARLSCRTDLKRATDHTCTIVHDLKAHAGILHDCGHSLPIICHRQLALTLGGSQCDTNCTRLAVPDGIVHRLLRYVVKVGSQVDIINLDRRITLEPAINAEHLANFGGTLLQSRHQSMGVGHNR